MKLRLLQALCLFCLATGAFAQGTTTGAATDAEQAITRLREGLVDSFNADDMDRLLTFLDTNAVVTWQNGEVCEGPGAVKEYYARMMKGEHPVVSKVSAEPEVLGRQVHGDWAVSWGKLNDHFILTDGRDLPLDSRFTATLIRHGGEWKVSAFHVSVNAFDNPILKLAAKKVALLTGGVGLLVGLIIGLILARVLWRIGKSE